MFAREQFATPTCHASLGAPLLATHLRIPNHSRISAMADNNSDTGKLDEPKSALEVYKEARKYHQAVDLLADQFGKLIERGEVNDKIDSFTPQVALNAFAAELYLKALLTATKGYRGGHDLYTLWKRLSLTLQREVKRVCLEEAKKHKEVAYPDVSELPQGAPQGLVNFIKEETDFEGTLDSIRKAFSEWRYPFEWDGHPNTEKGGPGREVAPFWLLHGLNSVCEKWVDGAKDQRIDLHFPPINK